MIEVVASWDAVSRVRPRHAPKFAVILPANSGLMERNWQYFIYLIAAAAVLLFVARARGKPGMMGYNAIALAIFLVLGVLLFFNALG